MSVKIEIVSADVRVIEVTKKSDQTKVKLRKQEAYLHNGHAYPERFEFSPGRDAGGVDRPAYPPGFYTVAPSSFKVNGQFGSLELDPYNLTLLRLDESKPAAASAKA